jgi:peptidylprolyl isomerase
MSLLKRSIAAGGPAALAALAVYGSACGQPAPAAGAAAPPAVALPAPTSADWRQIPVDNLMVIDTSKGRVVVEMRPEVAAEHVAQIKTLISRGFYDGLQFFRVIDEFMAQTGDSANTGAGESPMPELKGSFTFRRGPEIPFVLAAKTPTGVGVGFIGTFPVHSQPDDLALMTIDGKVRSWGVFCKGVAGMARTQNPDSASSQFFLMRGYSPFLNEQYTPWGRVVAGQDVVDALNAGEPPANPDTMTRVRMALDMPEAERPNLWRLDTASAAFKAQVVASQIAEGADFTACDVEPTVQAR